MGILDEAIREHLDLKRRRGADPAEVERAEREALGPVRRNREQVDAPEPDAADTAAGGFAYDHADDEDWSHGAVQDSLHEPAADGVGDELPEPDFGDAVRDPAPPRRAAGDAPSPPDPEPFPTAPASERPLSDMGGGETAEYRIEDVLDYDDSAPDEEHRSVDENGDDVLEETPEFLQDTPDHDRLWFEQRPPRDFDFDD
jgi:hypothetical protein